MGTVRGPWGAPRGALVGRAGRLPAISVSLGCALTPRACGNWLCPEAKTGGEEARSCSCVTEDAAGLPGDEKAPTPRPAVDTTALPATSELPLPVINQKKRATAQKNAAETVSLLPATR